MELQPITSNVARFNAGEETEFQIESSPEMFRILSDGMYKNKIGSMVREVTCNMLDSHQKAGWPERPGEIHMPDEFNPFISFRDYGTGLDEVGIKTVFTRYGKSTKRDDKLAIGAFGLGAKTPFAYSQAFTITAVKDGVQLQYAALINESGKPAVNLMDKRETEEPNGVTITVPVADTRDIRKFYHEVREQLTFLPVKPVLLNVPEGMEVEWKDYTAGQSNYMDIEGITVGDRYTSQLNGVWAVQGPVGYQVDFESLKQGLTFENKAFYEIIQHSAIIKFELGELEVIATREGIAYTAFTFAAFNTKLDIARAALEKSVRAQFASFEGPWNTAYGVNNNSTLSRMATVCKLKLENDFYYYTTAGYQLDLARLIKLDSEDFAPVVVSDDGEVEDTEIDYAALAKNPLTITQYTGETVRKVFRYKPSHIGKAVKVGDNFHILFHDATDKPNIRTKEWTSKFGRNMNLFVIENREGPVTEEQQEKILARIGAGFKNVTRLSEVDLPPPEARTGAAGYKAPTAYTYGKDCDFNTTRYWNREYLKLKEWESGGYYVIVDRLSITMPHGARVVTLMDEAGLLDRPIVAIRQKDADKLDATLWIPLGDKVKEVIEQVTSNHTLGNAYALLQHNRNGFDFIDKGVRSDLLEASLAGRIAATSPLNKVFRVERTLKRLKERARQRGYNTIVETAFRYAGADAEKFNEKINAAVSGVSDAVRATYPLLAVVRSDYYQEAGTDTYVQRMRPQMREHVIQYVNMFDAAAGA